MPDIQKILSQGSTSPADFTLHDSGHAFRVAHLMTCVIPEDVLPQLSSYELALLLLSAYLHDMGMTPERRKVTLHHHYLLTGDAQDLSQAEIADFQKWLDVEGRGIAPPLSQAPANVEMLKLADELTTYYCRDRHVAWSEEWIQKNLVGHKLGTYQDWIDDLVVLCRSHRQSRQDLLQKQFDPRLVGAPAAIVHLRYLAAALHLADTLDFDPERTPEVILHHRAVSTKSLMYWWKDHEISMAKEGNRLIVSARPRNARIHRAVEITVNQIDDELRLCRTLADETHFEKGPLAQDLPHRWDLVSSVQCDIRPKDDSYEYINGAFRPDTPKLLELLSGIELYGNPLATVRELVQNAFDAIREQIAYERLARPDPCAPGLESQLSQLHHVELRLESDQDGAWLICTDDGVGMTKAIIENHLLVSGRARRHDILELERRCKATGFSLGRTGQFGIGVLSYFMIADHVMFKTHRSQEPGDDEPTGWYFETDGVGSFGELRRDRTHPHGTEVHLHIRPEVIKGSLSDWFSQISKYLRNNLLRIPCQFKFDSVIAGCEMLTFQQGWTNREDNLSTIALRDLGPQGARDDETPKEFLSISRRQEIEADESHWRELQNEARQNLRWRVPDGELPDSLGYFRIQLPYFELPDGASLGFLRVRQKGRKLLLGKIGEGHVYIPPNTLITGWKGVQVYSFESGKRYRISSTLPGYDLGVITQVDWTSPDVGIIAVNRDQLKLVQKSQQALGCLDDRTMQMYQTFLNDHQDSAYAVLNCRLASGELPSSHHLNWIHEEGDSAEWRPLTFPAITGFSTAVEWKGKSISAASHLRMLKGFYFDWDSPTIPPDRIVVVGRFSRAVQGLWTRHPTHKSTESMVGTMTRFSPNWQNVCGLQAKYLSSTGYYISIDLWNPKHLVVHMIDQEGWQWCQVSYEDLLDPLPSKSELLKTKGRAAAWIIMCLCNQTQDLWNGLADRDPSFLGDLWKLVFGSLSKSKRQLARPILRIREHGNRLDVLTPEGWAVLDVTNDSDSRQIKKYLPDPGPEWKIVVKPLRKRKQPK